MTDVYLEVGNRRSFACAVDWPGWARAGRTPELALEALAASEDRYWTVLAGLDVGWVSGSELCVVETLEGDATTDFGAPSKHCAADFSPLGAEEAARLTTVLRACWRGLESAAADSSGELRKGPRGGGRELDAVLAHVVDAERAYAPKLGIRPGKVDAADPEAVSGLRSRLVEALAAGGSGERLGDSGKGWTARYAARRIAWHALDHAWEIEDRSV